MNKLKLGFLFISILFLVTLVSAFTVTAPESVSITGDKTTFVIKVLNDSDVPQTLTVNYFSTTKSKISAPKTISQNSVADITITVFNINQSNYQEVDSKAEIYVGKNLEERNITLKITPTSSNSSITTGAFSAIGGMFSLGSFFTETGTYSMTEWVIFWILVFVAAVLVIAFIARIIRRR